MKIILKNIVKHSKKHRVTLKNLKICAFHAKAFMIKLLKQIIKLFHLVKR